MVDRIDSVPCAGISGLIIARCFIRGARRKAPEKHRTWRANVSEKVRAAPTSPIVRNYSRNIRYTDAGAVSRGYVQTTNNTELDPKRRREVEEREDAEGEKEEVRDLNFVIEERVRDRLAFIERLHGSG